MNNYPEKILTIEVVERLVRLKRTLKNVDGIESGEAKIRDLLNQALRALADSLEPVMSVLSLNKELDKFVRVAIVRRVSDVFNSLDELHGLLQYIRSQGVRSETDILVSNVLEFIPKERRPRDVSVVLSNRYSFEEGDIRQYLDILTGSFEMEINEAKRPTLFLPTIERQNPLNWAILAHECGHFETEIIRSLQDDLKLSNKNNDEQKILNAWIEEIFCDLFAALILGPAYISCYSAFTLVTAAAGESECSSNSHPADLIRIFLIQEVLERSNLNVPLSNEILGEKDLTSFFLKLAHDRSKFERQYLGEHNNFPVEIKLENVVDIISEKINSVLILDKNLEKNDFSRVPQLVERIHKGILISAFPSLQQVEAIRLTENPQKRSDILKAIGESRTTIWEILNAGWLYKVERIYPEMSEIFFDTNKSKISEKIKKFENVLERLDGILLKSIEASEVFRLFGEIDGTDG